MSKTPAILCWDDKGKQLVFRKQRLAWLHSLIGRFYKDTKATADDFSIRPGRDGSECRCDVS